MCVCVCVCVCMCVYLCMYVCVYVCVYLCMYVCVYVCVCVCMHVCMYVYMCVCVCVCTGDWMKTWVLLLTCLLLFCTYAWCNIVKGHVSNRIRHHTWGRPHEAVAWAWSSSHSPSHIQWESPWPVRASAHPPHDGSSISPLAECSRLVWIEAKKGEALRQGVAGRKGDGDES